MFSGLNIVHIGLNLRFCLMGLFYIGEFHEMVTGFLFWKFCKFHEMISGLLAGWFFFVE